MSRRLTPLLMLAAAASCGTGRSNPQPAQITLTSSAFENGRAIPAQFTCDGPNHSPPLAWAQVPAGTKSFALIVDDPDAPGGTFGHWAAYDIAPTARAVAPGRQPGTAALNGFGKLGYSGPCPPKGNGVHHYRFKLYALDIDKLGLAANAKVADVERAARDHAIGQGELTATYSR